ncbi:hypothetical protein [Glycomyces dulcitolivorans]|uniref:hypothetical protein n=1 Tax=Glycomyces dulcitolivorans TaxID=2200759 RepID=UPI000DD37C78|nr:hypothetical protein [Glycomyces dulcitolivorans]
MADDNDPYGYIDDGEEEGEDVEDDILDAKDYSEADRWGMTASEERLGTPLADELAAEVPDVADRSWEPRPGDPVPDEPPGYPEPDPDDGPLPDEPGPTLF